MTSARPSSPSNRSNFGGNSHPLTSKQGQIFMACIINHVYRAAGVAGPLSNVTLYLPYGYSHIYKQMDSLLARAIHRNDKGCLTVVFTYPFPKYVFPLRFLNCTPITQLHVASAIFSPKKTRNFCLRAPKSLHLSKANLEAAVLEKLTSSACCPVLETLKLSNSKNVVFEPFNVSLTNSTVKHLHFFSELVYLYHKLEICHPM